MTAVVSVERPAGRAAAALEWGLDAVVAAFLPVVALAPHGAAPVAAVGGVLALGLVWPARASLQPRSWVLAALSGALLGWGALSALWAVDPQHSLTEAARLAGLFAVGLALIAAAPRVAEPERLLRWFVAGLILAMLLAGVQWMTKGALTQPFGGRAFYTPKLNQVENGLDLVVLPLAAVLWLRGRRILAILAMAAVGALVLLLAGDAGHLALLLGIVAALLVYAARRWVARAAALTAAVAILATPLVLPGLGAIEPVRVEAQEIKFSAWHRLEIWSFVGSRIAERPVLGWGLDSSRAIPGGKALTPESRELLPLHPHNAPLQLWVELGLPGALLAALLAARIWLALAAAAWPRLYAAAAGGSLAAASVVALGAYSVWAEWWIATELLALFVILVMGRMGEKVRPTEA
jgi:O-antigen ligase